MRAFSNVLKTINECRRKLNWSSEQSEGEVEGGNEYGVWSRIMCGQSFDKGLKGTTGDLAFLIVEELMREGLLEQYRELCAIQLTEEAEKSRARFLYMIPSLSLAHRSTCPQAYARLSEIEIRLC